MFEVAAKRASMFDKQSWNVCQIMFARLAGAPLNCYNSRTRKDIKKG